MVGQVHSAALAVPQQPATGAVIDQNHLPGAERGCPVAAGLRRAGDHRNAGAVGGTAALRPTADGVAHRPVGVAGLALHHPLGGTRNADQVAARKTVQLSTFHRRGVDGVANDQPGGGQVEHRVQGVSDPHVQRGGGPIGEYRVAPHLAVGPDEREYEAANQTGDEDQHTH